MRAQVEVFSDELSASIGGASEKLKYIWLFSRLAQTLYRISSRFAKNWRKKYLVTAKTKSHASKNRHLFSHTALNLILQIGEYVYGTLVIEATSGVVEQLESLRCIQFIQGFLDVPTIALHQHTGKFGGEAFYLKLDIVVHSSVLCNRLIALGVPKMY